MKVIKKIDVINKEQVENTLTERDVLEQVSHPFLVRLEFAFQSQEELYLLMKFYKGGELFHHLRKSEVFSEEQVKFYALQLILAIGYMHKQNIIYRDLKPENILLDEFGYISITDYGLAKFIKKGDLTNSFCGSPEYLSPEMIIGNGHNQATDWWSLGILIYEMLFGITPFYDDNLKELQEKIINNEIKYMEESKVSDEAIDFIEKLLLKDKRERLGSIGDIQEIKQHPWVSDEDWDEIL